MATRQSTGQDVSLSTEVEKLSLQIENSTTHYEAFGIARSATGDKVKLAHQQAPDSSKPAVPAEVASKNRKILVADDDHALRKVLGKILSSAGYEVILVEDGKAAVEKAKTERPDLVITDGLMPKMHGFLACKMIKELLPPPKVIMLTAVYTKMHYKWEARAKYGADELLTKPFEVAELLNCIERHLALSPYPEASARLSFPAV